MKIQKKTDKKIHKKMSFAEILKTDESLAEPLLEKGMHCIFCPMAMQESLEEGAIAHGLDPDKLTDELNAQLNRKKNKK